METIAEKLKRMGVDLPKAAAPAGSYVPIGRYGKALFIAGQIGVQQGTGSARLGAELGVEEGRAAATAAGLAVLAQIAAGTDGRVSTVRRIVRLGVFIAASTDFMQHPEVANCRLGADGCRVRRGWPPRPDGGWRIRRLT